MPFFSILIPLYNKENSIAETLQSVLDQTFTNYEIIIINDGSTDDSDKVVKEFTDERILYFSTKNNGISKARNLGIEKANGNLIAFLDADDFWYPNHLEILYKLSQKFPEAGLYATSYEKRFNSKATFPANFKNIDAKSNSMIIVKDFFDASTIDHIVWTSACAVPKNVLNSIGVFDTSITHGAGEDTDLWIRIALVFQVALATYITATYNLDAGNRVSNTDTLKRNFMNLDKFQEAEKNNQSLKNYLDQNRYAISLLYKSAGDQKTAKKYSQNIDYKNLNIKQKILLISPLFLYRFLKIIRDRLILNANIKLSAFE